MFPEAWVRSTSAACRASGAQGWTLERTSCSKEIAGRRVEPSRPALRSPRTWGCRWNLPNSESRSERDCLSFPVTDFDAQGDFDPASYRARLEWLVPYGASALFAAGGTGEFFSLEPNEYRSIVRTAVESGGDVPMLAGCGGPTRVAIAYAQEAERQGAAGVLLLPHYLTEASQKGLVAHVEAVCRSVRLGVVVYNRGACRLEPPALLELADRCPNLVGFKDGLGDIELMVRIRRALGDRFAYLGGLPTAEVFAPAYRALGVPVYSSAVFNFVPRTAIEFYRAVARRRRDALWRAARSVLPAARRAAQSQRRVCREPDQGRSDPGRSIGGTGASAADRDHERRARPVGGADRSPRPAMKFTRAPAEGSAGRSG